MPIKRIKNKVDKSNANFVKRLKDPNRKFIKDWAGDSVATHKLSVGTDENGVHFIYPNVQEINGKLVDYERPPYHYFAGQDNAVLNKDTVQIGNTDKDLRDAIVYTENYKKYYPKGNTFKNGGNAKYKIEAEGGELIQSNQPIKIKRGGMAVPLGNGFSLLKGRKHSQGGIDIDLQGDAKIWSSVPFLSGLSPAEKVLDGENPDKVFAQQESYKDRYSIKDDGTKKRFGGEDEDPITKGQQTRITQALDKSKKRTLPKVPYIEKDVITKTSEKNWLNNAKSDLDKYIEKEKEYKKHSQFIDGVKSPTLKSIYKKILNEHFYTQAEDINGVYKDRLIDNYNNAVTENNKKLMPGASCIYTILDNYNIKNPTPSNIEFKRNPRKYGFMQIPNNSIQPGDVVQENFGGIPVHAMMFDGYDKNGEMLFNYSKGGDDEYSIVKKGHYPMEEVPSVYRFIGQSQDSINWNKKQMGGDINKNGLIYNLNGNVVQGLGYIPSTGRRQKAKFGKWIANSFKSIGKGISNTYNNIKDYAKINPDKFNDYLSAGINTAGAVGSYLINENMLDNMSLPQTPISKQIIKLKTNYNINPQLDAAREAESRAIDNINNNTTSSNVALARINQARFANMLNTNTLYGNKENVETELINQDRQNQQNVLNSNIDSYNQYTKELTAAQNQINEARSENLISGINNIAQGFQDIISRREQRKQDNNTKWLHMISAPNAPEIPADFWNWDEDKKMQWWKNKDEGAFGNDGAFYIIDDINKMSRIERKRLGLQ